MAITNVFVIKFNETTQQKELKQAEEIKIISGTESAKELKNVLEFKIITDTGLK